MKLNTSKSKTYSGHARYHIVYDHDASIPNRYTVLLKTADDPIVIGRELDLSIIQLIIGRYEKEFGKEFFFGDRKTALKIHKKVIKNHG
jgi:hypothetical protein